MSDNEKHINALVYRFSLKRQHQAPPFFPHQKGRHRMRALEMMDLSCPLDEVWNHLGGALQ